MIHNQANSVSIFLLLTMQKRINVTKNDKNQGVSSCNKYHDNY